MRKNPARAIGNGVVIIIIVMRLQLASCIKAAGIFVTEHIVFYFHFLPRFLIKLLVIPRYTTFWKTHFAARYFDSTHQLYKFRPISRDTMQAIVLS